MCFCVYCVYCDISYSVLREYPFSVITDIDYNGHPAPIPLVSYNEGLLCVSVFFPH
jgi:hypothetical protein